MKILNPEIANKAKICIVLNDIQSRDMSKYANPLLKAEVKLTEILYVGLFDKSMKSISIGELRKGVSELEELLKVTGVNLVVDCTYKRDKESFVQGLLFKDIFHRDNNLWKDRGVLEVALGDYKTKFICTLRPDVIVREKDSTEIIDSEFIVNDMELDFIEVKDLKGLKECHAFLKTGSEITLDIETNMIDFAHKDSKILCIQVGIIENPNKVYLIWYEKTGIELEDTFKKNVKTFMQWLMLNKTVIAHNGSSFDIPWICTHFDIDAWKVSLIDTLVLGYIARNSTRRTPLGLKDLTYKYVADYDNALDLYRKEYCAEHKLKKEEFSYDLFPKDILAKYSFMDIVALNFIRKDLEIECRQHKGGDLYESSFLPYYKDFSKLISYMQVLGIPFNIKKAKEILLEKIKARDIILEEVINDSFVKSAQNLINKNNFDKAMKVYEGKVAEARLKGKEFKGKIPKLEDGKYGSINFNIEFNPNSTDHKRVLAFDILKLPIISKTLAGLPSADGDSFIKWAEKNTSIPILNVFSKLAKLEKEITGFYEPYIQKAENSRDGRLRGFYRINGTISGRISMTDINILQVPRESEFKYLLGFPEDSDYFIVNSDVTNLEGSQLTLMSLDEGLLDIDKYAKGDGHSFLAINLANLRVELFKALKGLDNKKIEDIKFVKEKYPNLRHFAKTANFSCIFGISGKGLARDLGISSTDGEAIVDGFWKTHKQAKEFFDRQEVKAIKHGYVDLIGGGKLLTPDADDIDRGVKSKAIRSSNNATIQSGSYITHIAMINIVNKARELGLDMQPITPWHDCCYYSVHRKDLVQASNLIQIEMERDFMENQLFPLISKPDIGKSFKGGFEVDTNKEGFEEIIREKFNI